jgi:molybdate transport system substrate-binding protein
MNERMSAVNRRRGQPAVGVGNNGLVGGGGTIAPIVTPPRRNSSYPPQGFSAFIPSAQVGSRFTPLSEKIAAKRNFKQRFITALGALGSFLMVANPVHAAELLVLSPQGMMPALSEVVPLFERSSGHQVTVSYSSTTEIFAAIQRGKEADVAILYPQQLEQLQGEDKIVDKSITPIAKLAFGIIIRKGATKPNVDSVRGLKQALISANSIATGDPENSASGKYFVDLIERLQIANAILPKIRMFPSGASLLTAVANGDVDLAIWGISFANSPLTELAGILPAQAKKHNSYAAGIVANSGQISAARSLSSFLASSTSLRVMKSKGFESP